MPNLSPLSNVSTFTSGDVEAPAAPIITGILQFDNTHVEVSYDLPSGDVDGGALSGLAQVTVVGGDRPNDGLDGAFDGFNSEQVLTEPDFDKVVVPLTPADAGTSRKTIVPTKPGVPRDYTVIASD